MLPVTNGYRINLDSGKGNLPKTINSGKTTNELMNLVSQWRKTYEGKLTK